MFTFGGSSVRPQRLITSDFTTEVVSLFSLHGNLILVSANRALFNQVMIRSIGKTQAKAHTQVMRASALPYNGKRQVLTIRTTPPEIGPSARYKPAPRIGPVQEIQKPILSDERSVSQAVAALLSTVESPSLFGGQPFVASNPLQRALELPDNESLRMNLTAAQALHGGNCVSGCP